MISNFGLLPAIIIVSSSDVLSRFLCFGDGGVMGTEVGSAGQGTLFTAAILTQKRTYLSRAPGPEAANMGNATISKATKCFKSHQQNLKITIVASEEWLKKKASWCYFLFSFV